MREREYGKCKCEIGGEKFGNVSNFLKRGKKDKERFV